MTNQLEKQESSIDGDVIAGRNAVLEALKCKKQIDTIYIQQMQGGRTPTGSVGKILALAGEQKIVVKRCAVQKLNMLCPDIVHQGVAAVCPAAEYVSIEHILQTAEKKGEAPFVIICDEIEDPHNLGAIIRTAEASGVHGVIIPKRRSASLTATVFKTSAGAASVMPVCRTGNLKQAVDLLKRHGVWTYCADMDGTSWCEVDYSGGVALVIGSEGKGVSHLLKKESDFVVSLPMNGRINSLNASVAAGILMYEVARQRLALKAR